MGHSSQQQVSHLRVLTPPPWDEYELIDSGDGQKLERFGSYRLVRPDTQAIWSPALPPPTWRKADATFRLTRNDDSPGEWVQHRAVPEQWQMQHEGLSFWARLTPFRHTGIFPENSAHWPWMRQQLRLIQQPNVLVLFGYTGLPTLVAAQAGAHVCHVDASKPAMRWARTNQEASRLEQQPVRWIVDDVLKFVAREQRRASRYDMILLDPPVFGRGPKGEIWRLTEGLPALIEQCVQLLSEHPVGILLNAYATSISSITLGNVLQAAMSAYTGETVAGELALLDTGVGRLLPTALYARWSPAN